MFMGAPPPLLKPPPPRMPPPPPRPPRASALKSATVDRTKIVAIEIARNLSPLLVCFVTDVSTQACRPARPKRFAAAGWAAPSRRRHVLWRRYHLIGDLGAHILRLIPGAAAIVVRPVAIDGR